jgi:RTX calcium-binding nonapeptide repeat (4 copies)/Calpain family cysteine protease
MKKILGALLAMTSAAAAGPTFKVGTGPTYDRENGDIVAGTVPVPKLASGIDYEAGVITVTGNSGVDTISITSTTVGRITVKRNSFTESYTMANLQKVVVYGNAGDDVVTNSTSVRTEINGGEGNDTLTGGSGKDFIIGGYGDDTIRGVGGDDVLWGSGGHGYVYGGDGDDILKGHGGDDHLYGEAGDDTMYGGSGDDYLGGGYGADTIVTIGGGNDSINGGSQNDYFWVDTTDTINDVAVAETTGGYVHKVSSYYAYSYDGGAHTTPVAKDLTNYNLLDPLADSASVHLENFADRPLFRASGPHKEDVLQGSGSDCYLLGPLSAVADATPDSIKKLVVDLDDGTYVVRLYADGSNVPQFVRVDADFWVNDSNNKLTYARLGLDEEALWLPVVEKAWAWFRRRDGQFATIASGSDNGSGTDAMGADNETVYETAEPYTAEQIATWDAAGRPAGAIKNHINATVPVLLNFIQDLQDAGRPVYTGNYPGSDNGSAFDVDHYRRGKHIIMIDHVNFDASGNPISLTVRDQSGNDYNTFTDFARIYFFIGRARAYDMQ